VEDVAPVLVLHAREVLVVDAVRNGDTGTSSSSFSTYVTDFKSGASKSYCGDGCQTGYGTCNQDPPKSPVGAPGSSKVSSDGTCGGREGHTCLGSSDGSCCSQYGWWYVLYSFVLSVIGLIRC
jgi:hypothetical protein